MTDYQGFLATKRQMSAPVGKEIDEADIHPMLYPFQRKLVQWAVRKGLCAIFADCGLGKTLMQLEWARLIGGRCLIVAPLAVAQQTVREGEKLGIEVQYIRNQHHLSLYPHCQIYITNYEMVDRFDASDFESVVLDESSILKSYMGKTKQLLLKKFQDTPYRLCCTATPAPNDLLELGNHSEFLGVMPSNEMISRWFINNPMQAGDYRIKKHAEADFWRWVTTWAMCVGKPSDIGCDDGDFVLPPLEIHTHYVEASDMPPPRGMLFDVATPNATTLHRQKRHTAQNRAAQVATLVNGGDAPWVVWCDTNYEADELTSAIPEAIEVRGNEAIDAKEAKLTQFGQGEKRVIITKPGIAGFGLNWQHCANVAFIGLSYSFEQFYQATRRTWRFGQTQPVNVHIMTTDYEASIDASIWAKQARYKLMQESMVEAVREVQMEELYGRRQLKAAETPTKEEGEGWQLWLGDCVEVTAQLPDDSIDFTIFSPPFSNLYIYSDSMSDMGNSTDDEEFMRHFDYLLPELYRVTVPGRLCAVHCKDLPLYKGRDGAAGLRDFPGQLIQSFERCGWTYHSRATIWKDPVIEMQRTKNHGLLHKQLCKDSAASRQGMADYLIVFRKWTEDAEFPKPVNLNGNTQRRFENYIGENPPQGKLGNREYSIQVWQRYASPVWFDINQTRVLNYKMARDDKDERHIAPLQLDVIDRSIDLWTNPGDTVFSPFAGIGSEGYEALKLDRRFIGVELKESYYQVALENLKEAVAEKNQQRLL